MKAALYIVGEPGAGKSELVAELTRGLTAVEEETPFAHRRYTIGGVVRKVSDIVQVVELGRRRGAFSGTDALGSTVITQVIPWLEEEHPAMLLAEGDRLAVDRFMYKLVELGYNLRIVLLWAPGHAARRRLQRGLQQDPRWVASRRTKVQRLVERWAERVQVVDASSSPAELAAMVDSPVATALRAAQEAR